MFSSMTYQVLYLSETRRDALFTLDFHLFFYFFIDSAISTNKLKMPFIHVSWLPKVSSKNMDFHVTDKNEEDTHSLLFLITFLCRLAETIK